jgi:hypothetical protein
MPAAVWPSPWAKEFQHILAAETLKPRSLTTETAAGPAHIEPLRLPRVGDRDAYACAKDAIGNVEKMLTVIPENVYAPGRLHGPSCAGVTLCHQPKSLGKFSWLNSGNQYFMS